MIRRHKLSVELSHDYSIIGIATQLKDYKLCLFLNKVLGIKLVRTVDIPVRAGESETPVSFPFYRYYDAANRINWYLLSNRNHNHQLILAGLKQLNFFLLNDGIPPFMDIKTFISSINKISNVQLAQDINIEKFKGIDYMLLDLELHLLELDRKNKTLPGLKY
jgi:hypothetical protein